MSRYIKAELALHHTIIYTDEDGRYFRFSGGTWAWRNHNPGNLYPATISARHNQIGRAKVSKTQCFAIFPDYESGHAALLDCLLSTYGESSIDDMVKDYAPEKDGNNIKSIERFFMMRQALMMIKKLKILRLMNLISSGMLSKKWKAIKKVLLLKFFQ